MQTPEPVRRQEPAIVALLVTCAILLSPLLVAVGAVAYTAMLLVFGVVVLGESARAAVAWARHT